jgi:hypothetical protein
VLQCGGRSTMRIAPAIHIGRLGIRESSLPFAAALP